MKLAVAIRRLAGCHGKERFESFQMAQKVARQVSRRRKGRIAAYHCPLCGGAHVGSSVRPKTDTRIKQLRYQYRAAPGEVRYYLEGIIVEPVESGGCMLVATDGHTLGAIFSEDARCDKARILSMSREFHRALLNEGYIDDHRFVRVKDENSRATLYGCTGVELFVMPGKPFIDGKIVEWRNVVPPLNVLQPGSPAVLAAKYVARIKRSVTYDRANGVTFWQDTRDPKNKAVVVRFEHNPELVVLIMPIRESDAVTWTEWYPKAEKAEEPQPAEAAT